MSHTALIQTATGEAQKIARNFIEENNDKNLHILVIQTGWQNKVMQPRDRIIRAIEGRKDKKIEFYDEGLKEFGRNNISS